MTDWLRAVREVAGDEEGERLVAEMLAEADAAKQHLRDAGHGVTGQGLLETVREAVPADGSER